MALDWWYYSHAPDYLNRIAQSLRLHGNKVRGEEEMFRPQTRPLTRILPAIALVVVGLALVVLLFR
jgi:hypothetical protein